MDPIDNEDIYNIIKKADHCLLAEAKETKKKRDSRLIAINSSSESNTPSCFGSNTLSSILSNSITYDSHRNESSMTLIEDMEMPSFSKSALYSEKLSDLVLSSSNPETSFTCKRENKNEDELEHENSISSEEFQNSLFYAEAEKVLDALHAEGGGGDKKQFFSPPSSRLTILDIANLNDSLIETPKSKSHATDATESLVDIPKMSTPKSEGNNRRSLFKQKLNLNGTFNKETPCKKKDSTLHDIEEHDPVQGDVDANAIPVNSTFDKEVVLGKKSTVLNVTGLVSKANKVPVLNATFEKGDEDINKVTRKLNSTFDNNATQTLAVNTTFEKEPLPQREGRQFNATFDAETREEGSPVPNLNTTFEVVGNGSFVVEGKCTTLMDMEAKDLDIVLHSGNSTPVKGRSSLPCDASQQKLSATSLCKRLSMLGMQPQDIGVKKGAEEVPKDSKELKAEVKEVVNKVEAHHHPMAPLTKEQVLSRLRKKTKMNMGGSGPMKAIRMPSLASDSVGSLPKSDERKIAFSTPIGTKGSKQFVENASKSNKFPLLSFGSVSSIDTEGTNSNDLGLIGGNASTPEVFRNKEIRMGPQITSTPALASNKFPCDLGLNTVPTPIICPSSKAFRRFNEVVNSSASDNEVKTMNSSSIRAENGVNCERDETPDRKEHQKIFERNLDRGDAATTEEGVERTEELEELRSENVLTSTSKNEFSALGIEVGGSGPADPLLDCNINPREKSSFLESAQQDSLITEYEMLACDYDLKGESRNSALEGQLDEEKAKEIVQLDSTEVNLLDENICETKSASSLVFQSPASLQSEDAVGHLKSSVDETDINAKLPNKECSIDEPKFSLPDVSEVEQLCVERSVGSSGVIEKMMTSGSVNSTGDNGLLPQRDLDSKVLHSNLNSEMEGKSLSKSSLKGESSKFSESSFVSSSGEVKSSEKTTNSTKFRNSTRRESMSFRKASSQPLKPSVRSSGSNGEESQKKSEKVGSQKLSKAPAASVKTTLNKMKTNSNNLSRNSFSKPSQPVPVTSTRRTSYTSKFLPKLDGNDSAKLSSSSSKENISGSKNLKVPRPGSNFTSKKAEVFTERPEKPLKSKSVPQNTNPVQRLPLKPKNLTGNLPAKPFQKLPSASGVRKMSYAPPKADTVKEKPVGTQNESKVNKINVRGVGSKLRPPTVRTSIPVPQSYKK